MEFSDLVKKRRACHNFLPGKKIPESDLKKIIEETSLTPSGYNCQPWEFIVIQKAENLKKLQEIAYSQKHLSNASAIIIVLADTFIGRNVEQILKDWLKLGYCKEEELAAYRNSIAKKRNPEKRKQMALRNTMLAAMTLMYSAENLGYSTCPMMGFSHDEIYKFLNLPEDREIGLLIAIGYGDQKKELPQLPRKNFDELVHFEKFENKNRKI